MINWDFYREKFKDNPKEGAKAILRQAMYKTPELMDYIKERACIRWSEGLSDSLFDAVLCNLTTLDEHSKRNIKGEIILQPKTNWITELSLYQ